MHHFGYCQYIYRFFSCFRQSSFVKECTSPTCGPISSIGTKISQLRAHPGAASGGTTGEGRGGAYAPPPPPPPPKPSGVAGIMLCLRDLHGHNSLSPFVKRTFRFYSEWYFFQQSSHPPPPPQPSTAVHAYALELALHA